MAFNEKNNLDSIPQLSGDSRVDPYKLDINSEVVADENVVDTKLFSKLKIGNSVKPDDDLDVIIDKDFSKQLALMELKNGIPVGGLNPVFRSGQTPYIDVYLDNDRKFTSAIPKKNFFMKNEESSVSFPGSVGESLKQKEASKVLDDLDDYYKKMEIFLEDYGPYYDKVSRFNEHSEVFREIFLNQTLTDGADSNAIFKFFKKGS